MICIYTQYIYTGIHGKYCGVVEITYQVLEYILSLSLVLVERKEEWSKIAKGAE